jgi:hypothetical protein
LTPDLVFAEHKSGDAAQWNMKVSRAAADVFMEFRNADGRCTVSISGGIATTQCKGKARKSTAGEDLKVVVGFYNDFQLPAVLGQMLAGKLSTSGPEGSVLHSEVSGASYSLALTQDALPEKLEFQQADPKSALKVAYLDYYQLRKVRQPKRLEFTRGKEDKPFLVVTAEAAESAQK